MAAVADGASDAFVDLYIVGRSSEYIVKGTLMPPTLGTLGTDKGSGGSDVLVVKITSLGKIEWARLIGGAGDDNALAVAANPKGGFIIVAGYTKSTGLKGPALGGH